MVGISFRNVTLVRDDSENWLALRRLALRRLALRKEV